MDLYILTVKFPWRQSLSEKEYYKEVSYFTVLYISNSFSERSFFKFPKWNGFGRVDFFLVTWKTQLSRSAYI